MVNQTLSLEDSLAVQTAIKRKLKKFLHEK